MIEADVGSSVLLSVVAADGNTGLFPQAEVYDSAGALVGSAHDLVHVSGGLYSVAIAAPAVGVYSVLFTFFTDAGHTTPAANDRLQKDLRVSAVGGVGQLNVSYDESTQTLFMETWLERHGQVVTTPTSVTVVLRDKDGTIVATQSSSSPQASGVFSLSQTALVLMDNRPYNASVTITDALGTVVTLQSLSTVA